MSATPTYDAVLEDLQIDPERIAARPAWSFEVAERVRKHRRKVLRSAASKKRMQLPGTKETGGKQTRTKQTRTKPTVTKKAAAKRVQSNRGQTKRPAAAK